MRRAALIISVLALSALAATAGAIVAGFPDVPDDHTHANGIAWAAENGLMVGYDNGNFGPEDPVLRSQLATIFLRYDNTLDDAGSGPAGPAGPAGAAGAQGPPGASEYTVFTITQDFGPGGIGGSWCGAPNANATDQGWVPVSGGIQFAPADVTAGAGVAGMWPNFDDPLNPGWTVQVTSAVDPGPATLYTVCIKVAD